MELVCILAILEDSLLLLVLDAVAVAVAVSS